ncbi:hypothetical protein MKEN_01188000 [Mycena kentingensis (nom. inval.)]|nr:hypothetical protein MKEN_01188000 [Mycena kentingensis (nom. inval.)]
MLSTALVILPLLAGVQAKNDWKVPCTSGTCSYDLPSVNGLSSSGSLKIWGGEDAITDITAAADWEIIGCNATAMAQDLRIVCKTDPDDPNSKCAHLYQNIGAVDKIVRLPENCGASAFARISRAWIPEDQSIPSDIAKRLVRRAGAPPVVKALAIDTNWDAVKTTKTGGVNFAIQAGNYQGVPTEINTGSNVRRLNGRKTRRFGFGDIVDGVKDAAGAVKDTAEDVGGAIKDGAEAAGDTIKDGAEAAKDAVTSVAVDAATKVADKATQAADAVADVATKAATAIKDAATEAADTIVDAVNKTINLDKSIDLPPIKIDPKPFNLISSSISCFGESLSMNVDVTPNADIQAKLDVVAKGKLVPPSLSDFGVVAVMNGQIGGTIDMLADVSGFLDSGFIPIFTAGIPGLVFPGIIEVGPTFSVDANINGQVDVSLDMSVGMQLDLKDAVIAFPPDAKNAPKDGAFSLGDSPMTINAAPNVEFTGSITTSLRPSLNLGVNVLNGKGVAEVFLAMDASAIATLDLTAGTAVEKDKNGGAAVAEDAAEEQFVDEDGNPVDAEGNPLDADGNPIEQFVDEDGNPVDADGTPLDADGNPVEEFVDENGLPVDADGNPLDENGKLIPQFVDEDGNPVDADGNPLDADGNPIEKFVDEDGNPVDAEGNPLDADGNAVTDDAVDTGDETLDEDSINNAAAGDAADVVDGEATVDDSEAVDETDAVNDSEATDDVAAEDVDETEDVEDATAEDDTASADNDTTVVDDAVTANDQAVADDSAVAEETPVEEKEAAEPTEAATESPSAAAPTQAAAAAAAPADEEDDSLLDKISDGAKSVVDGVKSGIDTIKGLFGRQDEEAAAADEEAVADENGDATFGGCFNVAANVNINVGLNGNLFGLFRTFKQKDLLNKDFQIFTKCFGDQAGTEADFASGGVVEEGFDSAGKISADQSAAVSDGTAVEAKPDTEGVLVDDATGEGAARRRRSATNNTSRFTRRRTTLERRINLSCPIGARRTRIPLHSGTALSSSITTLSSKVLI